MSAIECLCFSPGYTWCRRNVSAYGRRHLVAYFAMHKTVGHSRNLVQGETPSCVCFLDHTARVDSGVSGLPRLRFR